jgi:polyisoprenyl-phosphate glycosyltransferase
LGYRCYRLLFFLLTGTAIRFGNFSHIPGCQLDKLVYYPDLWNSFSGCIRKSGLPLVGIPSHRATRYIGPSKMNTMALILHGLSAISVLKEKVLVRLLIATALFGGLGALVALFSVSLHDTPALTAAAALFCLFALQALLLLLALTFSELQHRSHYQQGPTFFWRKQVKSLETLKQD